MKKNNILRYLGDYRKECVLSPIFKFLESAMELFVPLVVAKIIDQGIPNKDDGFIWSASGILLLFGTLGLAFAVCAQFFAAKASVGFGTKVRRELFVKIQSFPYSTLDKLGAPTLITRITSDINQIQSGVNLTLRLVLRSPFIVFGSLIFAMTIDAKISSIFVVAILLLGLIVGGIMLINIPLYKKIQGKLDGVLMGVRNNLTGSRVVRAFNREEAEKDIFNAKNEELTTEQIKTGRIASLLNPLTFAVVNVAIVLIMRFGAVEVNIGTLTQGEVVALFNYMSQILIELIKLARLILNITKSIASGKRVQSVLDMESGELVVETIEQTHSNAVVEFKNVSLIYDNAGAPSLTNISFTVNKGETVGIIGGTGSGKTSLVNLIPRFYLCSDGEVLIDGKNVLTQDPAELRKKIHIVPQKATLFSGSIRENLLWGGLESDDRLWQALEIAQCKEVVENKDGGLDAVVAQDGRNFSGGQRQRLTVARGLVGNPDILILDDSSSALDYATDAALRKAITEMENKPTTFIVSQRASSVLNADKIIVLDDGKMVGLGTHQELINSCKEYSEIYYSQFGKGGNDNE